MLQVIMLKVSSGFIINYNYLVIDNSSRNAVIVDPAWQMEKIEDAISDFRVDLCGILITHAHPDHIHLAEPLNRKYNCPIWISKKEAEHFDCNSKSVNLIDEKPIVINKMIIKSILTPGHTSGSMCYLIGDNLFTGDTLFSEGCGMCSGTNAAYQMFESLNILKKQVAPHTRIYPGHSYGKTPGMMFSQVTKENIYLNFEDKFTFAAYRLRKNQNRLKLFDFC